MAKNEGKTRVSGASTPETIGAFWDSHSLESSPSVREVRFEVHARPRHRVILDPELYSQLESEARLRGVSSETLANRWLTERLAVNTRRSTARVRQSLPLQPPNTYEDSPRQETKISSTLKKRIHPKSANKKHR